MADGIDRDFQVALRADLHDLAGAAAGASGPPESGRSSFTQKTIGATFSVASTGIVRTPDGKAVAFSPSLVGRAPVPPESQALTSLSGTTGRLPRACPDTDEPPRSGGFHKADAPSAVTRSGTAWCRQPIMRSGSRWPITWRTDTG